MAGLSGFQFLLKTPLDNTISKQASIPDITTDFTTIGGFQSNSCEISASEIDITNKSSGENREILDRHGLLTLNTSGAGVLQDSQIAKDLEQNLLDQDLRWFLLERSDGRNFIAKFKIGSYNFDGNHDGSVNFSINLLSSGALYMKDNSGFEYDTVSDRITSFNNQASTLRYKPLISAEYALASIPTDKVGSFTETIRNYGIMTAGSGSTARGFRADGSAYGSVDPDITNDILQFYQSISSHRIFVAPAQAGSTSPDRIIINDEIITSFQSLSSTTHNSITYHRFETPEANVRIQDADIYKIQLDTGGASLILPNASINTVAEATAMPDTDITLSGSTTANEFAFPIVAIRSSDIGSRTLQVLDSLDQVINPQPLGTFYVLGVAYSVYYIDVALGMGESLDVKLQAG